MGIETQEQFEKLRAALKDGKYSDRPDLQAELIMQAKEWKAASQAAPPPPPPPSIPQGGSVADTLGQGLSFGFSDELAGGIGAGINSIAGIFGGGTGEDFGDAYRGIRDAARSNVDAFSERNPKTALATEIVGGMLTGGAGAARTGAFNAAKYAPTLLGRLAPVAATGAVQGGLYGAGASEAEDIGGVATDTLTGAAVGGVTAPLLPAIAGGARSVARNVFDTQTANKQFQAFKELLERKVPGLRLTTGQGTGSESIRSIETTVGGTLTGGRVQRQLNENRRSVQGKLMSMAGFGREEAADGLITINAINKAQDGFSKKYTTLLGGRTMDLSNSETFVNRLYSVQAKNQKLLPTHTKKQVTEIVNELFDDATSKPITATRYNLIRSDLARLERGSSNNTRIAELYRDLKRALDDTMADELGVGTRKAAIDRQYNRFTKIRDTFDSSGSIGTARGELPMSMLLRRSANRGKGADQEFTDIVRAAQAVLGDPQPNSGTTTRAINAMLLGGSAFDPTGASTGLLLGAPLGAAQVLSRGYTGSNVVDRLIQGGLLTAPIVGAAQ